MTWLSTSEENGTVPSTRGVYGTELRHLFVGGKQLQCAAAASCCSALVCSKVDNAPTQWIEKCRLLGFPRKRRSERHRSSRVMDDRLLFVGPVASGRQSQSSKQLLPRCSRFTSIGSVGPLGSSGKCPFMLFLKSVPTVWCKSAGFNTSVTSHHNVTPSQFVDPLVRSHVEKCCSVLTMGWLSARR